MKCKIYIKNNYSNKIKSFGKSFLNLNFAENDEIIDYRSLKKEKYNLLLKKFQLFDGVFNPNHGAISPACSLCMKGKAIGFFISERCNASCKFCCYGFKKGEQKKFITKYPTEISELLKFVNCFKLKGIGFTGGEPLLEFEKVLTFIKRLKKEFPNIYLWLYTNGILLSEGKLSSLKKAGLDEIRIDLAANNYDVQKIKLAKKFIKRVAVEMPLIPKDYHKLKKASLILQKFNLDHLNIIQLEVTSYNASYMIEKKYKIMPSERRHPYVIDSDSLVLDYMLFYLKNNFSFSLNYCSKPYRDRVGIWEFINYLEPFESITSLGYVRVCKSIIKKGLDLEQTPLKENLYKKYNNILFFNPKILLEIIKISDKIEICYYNYKIIKKDASKSFSPDNILLKKELVSRFYEFTTPQILDWYSKYISLNDKSFRLSRDPFYPFERGANDILF